MAYQITVANYVTIRNKTQIMGTGIALTNDVTYALEAMKKTNENLRKSIKTDIDLVITDIKEVPDDLLRVSKELLKYFQAVVHIKPLW